jgi:hypothetical protein
MMVAAAILMAGAAQAATLVSPPLHLLSGDDYRCMVVNAGTKAIASAKIAVSISGSTPGSGFTEDCGPVDPGVVCAGDNEAGGSNYRFCTIDFIGSKSYVRGSFCNTTQGVCVPLQ